MMEESFLPEIVRRKATVSPGGEHAWRLNDVEEAVRAAAAVGLACLGGQVQFQLPDGTCEAYWLSYDSSPRQANESWEVYVHRSAMEVLEKFRELRTETDFTQEARRWPFIEQKMREDGLDPRDHVFFLLYFEGEGRENR